MTTFRCTKKLLQHIGVKPGDSAQRKELFGPWCANIVRLDRRSAVIYTNERTLFSFAMFKVKAKNPQQFHAVFLIGLSNALALEGHSQPTILKVLETHDASPSYTVIANRRVLGSMNAIYQDLSHMVWYQGGLANSNVSDLTHKLNNTPWGAIGYNQASQLVAELMNARNH